MIEPIAVPCSHSFNAAECASQLLDNFGSDRVRFTISSEPQKRFKAPLATVMDVAAAGHPVMSMHEGVPRGMVEEVVRSALSADCPWRGVIETDMFPVLMPEGVCPETCLVLGGAGACSSLHADPFDWTGWSLLLTGEKKWRFWDVATSPEFDCGSSLENSPGSGVSLWPSPEMTHCFPAAADRPAFGARGLGASIVATPQVLSPSSPSSSALSSSSAITAVPEPDFTLVQRAGEFLFFPASRWHHVEHVQGPTVALCGQVCRSSGGRRGSSSISSSSITSSSISSSSISSSRRSRSSSSSISNNNRSRSSRSSSSSGGGDGCDTGHYWQSPSQNPHLSVLKKQFGGSAGVGVDRPVEPPDGPLQTLRHIARWRGLSRVAEVLRQLIVDDDAGTVTGGDGDAPYPSTIGKRCGSSTLSLWSIFLVVIQRQEISASRPTR